MSNVSGFSQAGGTQQPQQPTGDANVAKLTHETVKVSGWSPFKAKEVHIITFQSKIEGGKQEKFQIHIDTDNAAAVADTIYNAIDQKEGRVDINTIKTILKENSAVELIPNKKEKKVIDTAQKILNKLDQRGEPYRTQDPASGTKYKPFMYSNIDVGTLHNQHHDQKFQKNKQLKKERTFQPPPPLPARTRSDSPPPPTQQATLPAPPAQKFATPQLPPKTGSPAPQPQEVASPAPSLQRVVSPTPRELRGLPPPSRRPPPIPQGTASEPPQGVARPPSPKPQKQETPPLPQGTSLSAPPQPKHRAAPLPSQLKVDIPSEPSNIIKPTAQGPRTSLPPTRMKTSPSSPSSVSGASSPGTPLTQFLNNIEMQKKFTSSYLGNEKRIPQSKSEIDRQYDAFIALEAQFENTIKDSLINDTRRAEIKKDLTEIRANYQHIRQAQSPSQADMPSRARPTTPRLATPPARPATPTRTAAANLSQQTPQIASSLSEVSKILTMHDAYTDLNRTDVSSEDLTHQYGEFNKLKADFQMLTEQRRGGGSKQIEDITKKMNIVDQKFQQMLGQAG